MGALFGRIVTWFAQILAPIFIEKIGGMIKDWQAKRAAAKEAKDQALINVEKLKNAKSKDEINAGIDDSLKRF